ncbi:MAG: ribosome small subunit-dependent GTPase A [Bacilli bacterium]|nr:ribosome small subunit-dependent GTPase A [Bacilli bacterium]
MIMTGRIVKIISNTYTVSCDGEKYECIPRGKFRYIKTSPKVGDIVEFNKDTLTIDSIEPRFNELKRPEVANIDIAIIVTSLTRPDFSSYLLDKMIANVVLKDIKPIIVLTKADLLSDEELNEFKPIIDYYNSIGIPTLLNSELDKLKSLIKGSLVTLTGQTGVGKSTLINKIKPELNLETNDISEALGRGKHTTRHTEVYDFKDFYIVDTPGFSALDLDILKENLRFAFVEFDNSCKFNDCMHLNEIGCRVKEQVSNSEILESRYENYKRMVEEYEDISKYPKK